MTKRRWFAAHLVIGLLILLNAALVLVPTGAELLDLAVAGGTEQAFAALKARESTFGAINLLLALVTVFVAVLRPRLGQPQP